MLNRLSKYRQEIAISLITLFLIGDIIPFKANAAAYNNATNFFSTRNYRSSNSNNAKQYNDKNYPEALVSNAGESKIALAKDKPKPTLNKFIPSKVVVANKLQDKPFIGGPGQPEMGAFKPVGADNMVDLFSGDMSYNIPLLDVGGYPVNIFYNSGITMDQEASWAGLGWNINPGTIMRNMRGVPDDFNGTDKVTKTLSMRDDKTWGVGIGGGIEIAGTPSTSLGLGSNLGVSFNNMRGMGMDFGINASVSLSKGGTDEKTNSLTLGVGLNLSSQGGATVTPSISLSQKDKNSKAGTSSSGSLSASIGYNSRAGLQSLHLDAEVSKTKTTAKVTGNFVDGTLNIKLKEHSSSMSVMSSNISFAYPSVTPSIRARLSRLNMTASLKLGYAAFFLHPNGTLNGYYSQSRIAEEDKITTHPAYGVMFYQKANNDVNALLDFNRLQDGVFTKNNPAIAIPTYNYDVFSISGEGVGGSFRAYRGDLGYVHDATVSTRDDAGKIGFDIGLGPLAAHGGVNLEYVYSPTTAGSWDINNLAKNTLQFRETKADTQMVYFKNPGEKTIPDVNFQNAIGGEDLVRLKMASYKTGSPVLLPTLERFDGSKNVIDEKPLVTNDIIKGKRDKRTQIISCLNAEEASRVGFDKDIKSYDPNYTGVVFGNCNNNGVTNIKRNTDPTSYTGSDKYRRAHHISEIDVLGGDGRKYVYGIPVYNTQQIDATFNVNGGDANTQRVGYQPGDDTKANSKGRDWYIEKEEMPAYTHSFLLTELISPNYVDLKGDGITEDDMGDAVKFNYSKFDDIKWRNPIGTNIGTYSEGFKTNTEDGKAHYTYGVREQWYLYSVESKNMVAKFYVKNDRKDGKAVTGVDGSLDPNYGAQRLEKISLFSKGDLVKFGSNAKPIKTVYLEYDYSLCGNTPTNSGEAWPVGSSGANNLNAKKGKLTLRSIYFTYNGNERAKKNKYTFHYPSDKNPDYNYSANDRWGNYKPAIADAIDGGQPNNLGGLSNSDYPYSVQNKAKADKYAGAWVMDSIGLPSGGKIKIDYEADDYAYVQDRRASTMYQISGFGSTKTPTNSQLVNNRIYDKIGVLDIEYNYIYATIPLAISTTQSLSEQQRELQSKYFNSFKNNQPGQLLVKLNVQVQPGDGFEIVPFYADIESYGLIAPTAGTTSNKIYIKVKRLEKHTPMVQYTLSFLKNNLPGKAFPGYDNTEGGLAGVVRALAGMFNSLKELFNGVDNNLKNQNKCRFVDNSKSFVRLTNPYFSKEGGGLRVKKVTISDNWNKMTGQAKSTYGQEYKYTKQELINDKVETISSGVAAWEPAIGGEENPHREMMTYSNHNKGGPFEYNSVEFPLAEMFFPSASVGYSHVEVLPIHRDTVKNAVGKSTTDYFTTRDFPTKSDYTFLTEGAGASFHEDPTILAIFRIRASKHYALSQGFKVDLNDMNGKVRLQESFGANGQPISHTENFYNTIQNTDQTYKFNHTFQTLNSPNGVLTNSVIGRDIELMTDMRNHNSQTISTSININIDGQMIGVFPIIIPPLFSPVFFEENDYRSASMLKIVNHFGMLDSTVVIDKGSKVSTKNLVYDAETGNVLLTRTNNEYDKPIYNFTYPAHWAYSGMGPAYKNIDVVYNNLTFRNGILENAAEQNVNFKLFESGDELYVYSPLTNGPLLTSCDQGVCSLPKNPANRVWVVNTNKTGGPNQVAFMDAQGNPYQAMQVTMRIIRSGYRNMLEQMVGGITSLNSPIVNGQLVFNDATGIIQTSAATFKDHWRVDDAMYRKDSIVKTITYVPVQKVLIESDSVTTVTKDGANYSFAFNDHPIISSLLKTAPVGKAVPNPGGGGTSSENDYLTRKAWVKFDDLKNKFTELENFNSVYFYRASVSGRTHSNFFNNCLNSIPHPSINHNGIHTFPDINNPGDSVAYTNFRDYSFYGNTVVMQEMKTPWYERNNEEGWKNTFDLNDNYSSNSILDQNLDGNYSTAGLFNNGFWNNGGCNLPLQGANFLGKDIVSNMFNRHKNGENINPSFSFQTYQRSTEAERENLFCWWNNNFDLCRSCGNGNGPKLDLYYFACNGNITTIVPEGTDGSPNGGNKDAYALCESFENITVCRSRFSNALINPYVEGIYGNWRADSTYSYYGTRKETDPAIAVDIRTGGTITGYKDFWNFNTDAVSYFLKRNYVANREWAWNSTSTQFNRKGYETENKDPLGRFNAGVYGYNQQLPIAVANNARLREVMYDGFEDYDYKTGQTCGISNEDCAISGRHAVFAGVSSTNLTTLEHHTGRYSLKVPANGTIQLGAAVKDAATADAVYNFNLGIAGQQCNDTIITPNGKGYRLYDVYELPDFPFAAAQKNINVEKYFRSNQANEKGRATWVGLLLPTKSGVHDFYVLQTDDHIHVYIQELDPQTGLNVGNQDINFTGDYPSFINSQSAWLKKGIPYVILVFFDNHGKGDYIAKLKWRTPDMKCLGKEADFIPTNQVYRDDELALFNQARWVGPRTVYSLTQSQASGNRFNDKFAPLQGTKMVLSAWVKESTDCKCSTYVNNAINLSFNGAPPTEFKPSGNIIEGWQRYEAVFDVPAAAYNMTVTLKNNSTTGADVFFDDMRIHPFNANEKSFVYHSSNLRLMAELDENNYASYYEYDDDGTLTRVKKETQRGIKTITETRSALHVQQ